MPFITAVFETGLPDDSVWTADGMDLVQPGGRPTVAAICQQLRSRGYICTDIEQQEYYGWAFDAKIKHNRVRCVGQEDQGECRIVIQFHAPIFVWLFKKKRIDFKEDIRVAFSEIILDNLKFRNLKWKE